MTRAIVLALVVAGCGSKANENGVEGGAGGSPAPAGPARGEFAAPVDTCQVSVDCANGGTCYRGMCWIECDSDDDCPRGLLTSIPELIPQKCIMDEGRMGRCSILCDGACPAEKPICVEMECDYVECRPTPDPLDPRGSATEIQPQHGCTRDAPICNPTSLTCQSSEG